MRILAVHSIFGDNDKTKSAVDTWRIWRPLRELKKHVDWQIDEQPTLIRGIEKYKDKAEFTEMEMQEAFNNICHYDIVFSSYRADATGYTLLKVAADKAGVQFIMDVDDDMFAINPDNPFWITMNDEKAYWMQCMIRDNTWISTTTKQLADVFIQRRVDHKPESVFINPNFITDDYKHAPLKNKDIVIGYFGGSSHYADIHETGLTGAITRIMHEYKNVRLKAVGMPFDSYVPKKRYEFVEGKRFNGWVNEIYPNLNMDIALGPLKHDIFNKGKSNIKWQEATRAGALFIASDYGPYKGLKNALLVKDNTEDDWYNALKKAVDDEEYRRETVKMAQQELEQDWRLESQWKVYKAMFEKVKEYKDANNKTIKGQGISTEK